MKKIKAYRSVLAMILSMLFANIILTITYLAKQVIEAKNANQLPMNRDLLYEGLQKTINDPLYCFPLIAVFCVLFYIFFRKGEIVDNRQKTAGRNTYVKYVIFSFAVGCVTRVFLSHLLELLIAQGFVDENVINAFLTPISSERTVRFFQIFVVTAIVPVYEELMFRKLLFNDLKKIYSKKKALCISYICFILMHMNLNIFYAIPGGAVALVAYARYGDLLLSVLIHAAFNLIGSVQMPFIDQNSSIESIILGVACGVVIGYMEPYISKTVKKKIFRNKTG